MFTTVNTQDPAAVQTEAEAVYAEIFPGHDPTLVARVFECVIKCFRGECRDYQAIDARYHDLEHTLQGLLCFVRLLRNRHRARVEPRLDQRTFELGLLAMLLHDTGYAKKRNDASGTGAKYTFTHVARSAQYAADLLGEKGFSPQDIQAVQHMIRCTGVNVELDAIPFQTELERLVGYALGTADFLGQMAADDYVDKLPVLYAEFQEAAAFCHGQVPRGTEFQSAEDLIRRTPAFWEKHVWVKINHDFRELYRFLEEPYPGGPNEYLERIRANLARITPPPPLPA